MTDVSTLIELASTVHGLTLTNNKLLDWSKLKAFADDNINEI